MPNQIARTFVSYFRSIFSSSAMAPNVLFAADFPQDSQDPTYSTPDKKELWDTLSEMKKSASPGPDGFNVEFYIATWEWIGDDVFQLVKGFFLSGNLPAHLNDTHSVLIPKKTCSFSAGRFQAHKPLQCNLQAYC